MTTLAKVLELAGIAPDATEIPQWQLDRALAIAREQGRLRAAQPAAQLSTALSPGDKLNAEIDRLIAERGLGNPIAGLSPIDLLNADIDRLVAGRNSALGAGVPVDVLRGGATSDDDNAYTGDRLNSEIDRLVAQLGLGKH
jgi:hypothetical protein